MCLSSRKLLTCWNRPIYAKIESSPQLNDKSPKVRVCEGGKLIKKAKEEVPQPFVIGCGGEIIIGIMQARSSDHIALIVVSHNCFWDFLM